MLFRSSQRTPSEVVHFIDTQCVDPLAEFADSRQAMVKRFGMKVYADVMTEFASAERMVNRSWSAAADGYVDEVDKCLKMACEHFARADELLTAAEQHSSAA